MLTLKAGWSAYFSGKSKKEEKTSGGATSSTTI
jgi:hypothetical protein